MLQTTNLKKIQTGSTCSKAKATVKPTDWDITMLIGGLWYGAAWIFVALGALHGVALCIHKIWQKLMHHDKNHKGTFICNLCSGIITYLFVCNKKVRAI